MSTRNSVLRASLVLGVVLLWVGVACAEQLININFLKTFPDPPEDPEPESELVGPAGGLGTTWNQFAAQSSTNTIFDSTGEPTTVELTSTFPRARSDGTGASLRMLRSTMLDDARGANRSITITGLEPEERYHIWLVSHRHQNPVMERQYGTWTADNDTTSPSVQTVDGRDGSLTGSEFVEGVNYALFENVLADENGHIVFHGQGNIVDDGDNNTNHRMHLNGLQIQESGELLAGPVDADVSTVEVSLSEVIANGNASATVTVTLRDAEGIPAAGREVILTNTAGPQQALIDPSTAQITSSSGEATFSVSSTTVGTEVFTATKVNAENIVITQTASVTFIEARRLFSVNLFGYGRQNAGDLWLEEEVRSTVRIDGVKEAGIWSTTAWNDLGPSSFPSHGTAGNEWSPNPIVHTITAEDGVTTATLTTMRSRSPGAIYLWLDARNPATWDDGNASLMDGFIIGTFDLRASPENPQDRRVKFEISDIPFAHYEIIFYFGHSQGQWSFDAPGGTANLRYNEQIDSDPEGLTGGMQFRISHHPTDTANAEPSGHLREIVEEGDTGNYIVLTDLSGPVFRGEIWGQSMVHAGPSGFQIQEVVMPPSGTMITIR